MNIRSFNSIELLLISTSAIYSVFNKQQIRRIKKTQQFTEVLILILSLALIKKLLSIIFFYLFNDMNNINTKILTCLMMFWMKKMQSQKDLPWTWNVGLEIWAATFGCFRINKSNGRGSAKLFDSKGRTKVWFSVWDFWIFLWRFQLPFLSLFYQSLFPKANPLNVWWSKVFIDGFVVVLGGKQKGFKPFWYTVPLLFSHSFRMPIWCKYGVWESAGVVPQNLPSHISQYISIKVFKLLKEVQGLTRQAPS